LMRLPCYLLLLNIALISRAISLGDGANQPRIAMMMSRIELVLFVVADWSTLSTRALGSMETEGAAVLILTP